MSVPEPDSTSSTAKSARFEIKFVLWLVGILIVLGGLYVFVFGSPTRNRAAIDSENSPPGSMYVKATPSAPQTPPPH